MNFLFNLLINFNSIALASSKNESSCKDIEEMNNANFIVQCENRIARVTINRPERRNAFKIAMWDELTNILQGLERQPEIRVVILTGRGEKAFASGADISEMVENYPPVPTAQVQRESPGSIAIETIQKLEKVLIAMINGYAIGGGCVLGSSLRFEGCIRKNQDGNTFC